MFRLRFTGWQVVVALGCIALLAGCEQLKDAHDRLEQHAERQKPVPPPPPTSHFAALDQLPADTEIRLSESGCRGTCPVYSVVVDGTGKVTFNGRDHVARFGTHERQLEEADVLGLLRRADEVGFFNMTPEWLAKSCFEPATDLSSARLKISAGGKTFALRDYGGCDVRLNFGEPAEPGPRDGLRDLMEMVRNTAVPEDWFEPSQSLFEIERAIRKRLPDLMPMELDGVLRERVRGSQVWYGGTGRTFKFDVDAVGPDSPRRGLEMNSNALEVDDLEVRGFPAKRGIIRNPEDAPTALSYGEIVVYPTAVVQVRLVARDLSDPEELRTLVESLPLERISEAPQPPASPWARP